MIESSVRVKSNRMVEAPSWTAHDEESLLVAALAATLVEYRRHVGQRNASTRSEGAGPNWRMMARLEQLRG